MKTAQPQKRKRPLTDAFLNSLPLWKLLSIAMVDLRKQECEPLSEVDMGNWLVQNGNCKACLAGSVMRFSCGISGTRSAFKGRWNCPHWANAVDSLRRGEVGDALSYLARGGGSHSHKLNRRMSDYFSFENEAFWRDITKLRDDLKKAGL